MHLNSQLLFNKYALNFFKEGMKVLEIGADTLPTWYCKSVNNTSIQWHTLDVKKHLDTIEIGKTENPLQIASEFEYNYPVDDNTFDVVFSAQVMEHVKNIWKWVDELKRITKKGGLIIIIAPVSWPYHVAAEVEDCWRIYPQGMKALLEEKGLEIIANKFESLEKTLIPPSVPTLPGEGAISSDDLKSTFHKKLFKLNRVLYAIPSLRKFRIPLTVSYDCFCVSRKN